VQIRVLAVGSRMPQWVDVACADYLKRLAPHARTSLTEIPAAPRSAKSNDARAIEAEGERLLATLEPGEYVVLLAEQGHEMTTRALAAWLEGRRAAGRDLACIIGGADGVSRTVQARADFTLALSRLTLPHALARVVLLEQLYRAHTILAHHPYHRD
jgi:23S rRNA (pseudouridine1915-N3)-methyltransferase